MELEESKKGEWSKMTKTKRVLQEIKKGETFTRQELSEMTGVGYRMVVNVMQDLGDDIVVVGCIPTGHCPRNVYQYKGTQKKVETPKVEPVFHLPPPLPLPSFAPAKVETLIPLPSFSVKKESSNLVADVMSVIEACKKGKDELSALQVVEKDLRQKEKLLHEKVLDLTKQLNQQEMTIASLNKENYNLREQVSGFSQIKGQIAAFRASM